MTVVPHLLEAGDVVEIEVSAGVGTKFQKPRRCKIITIDEPDAAFLRDSLIEWLDTSERENKQWKAAKGVNLPVWVVDGPKLRAALRREANVRRNDMGRWIWEGYCEEAVGV